MKYRILSLIVTLGIINACKYDNAEELYPDVPPDCETNDLTYTKDIEAIFSVYCIECHDQGRTPPRLVNIHDLQNNEATIKDRITRGVLEQGYMPGNNVMPKCEVDKILAWYADGTPE